jgi:hypothetical protein
MTTTAQATILAQLIATFPQTFGLRNFPGDRFRISADASYFSRMTDTSPMLYTQRQHEVTGEWNDFVKGTPGELRAQLTADPRPQPTKPKPKHAKRPALCATCGHHKGAHFSTRTPQRQPCQLIGKDGMRCGCEHFTATKHAQG